MEAYSWYQTLRKPSWAPPPWLFGPVWTFLYVIIAASYGYVFYLFLTRRVSFMILLPFVLNLSFNVSFTPLQFPSTSSGQVVFSRMVLATLDVLLVLGTLVWEMVMIFPFARWVSLANIPYLIWVCFATVLQLTVTYLNRKKIGNENIE